MTDAILTLRAPSGISGDMLVAGLAGISGLDAAGFAEALSRLGLAELENAARLVPRSLDGIAGIGLEVVLPHAHEHRHLADIQAVIARSAMAAPAKDRARDAFRRLAEAEAAVHGGDPEEVHFHEVGALDSILDICLACELFERLGPARFVCSPLPICDGTVRCAHGLLATPAPAVLHLLRGMPVRGVPSEGETVTPTAASLLSALGASFGPWPAMVLERHARVFGTRVLPGIPNGAIFALGRPHDAAFPEEDEGAPPVARDDGAHDHGHGHGGDPHP